MPKEFSRTARVAEQLHRELSILIQREVEDPRVGMVTITDVDVSKDLAHARVFFSVLADDNVKPKETEVALNHAGGFLRRELRRRLALRQVPALRFRYDETPAQAARIEALLSEVGSSGDTSRSGDS